MAGEVESGDQSEVKLLSGHITYDHYDGVIIHINDPLDSSTFLSSLTASIAHWKLQGKRGIWMKLPIEQVNLVEAAVKNGFWYHHAEPNYLMLVYWIPQSPHTLPANATHSRNWCFCCQSKQRVVQEKTGLLRGTGVWKFPTGLVDEGEDIYAAAVREVKEETGIDSEFMEVLTFRQSHKSFFEKSDLFFVCMLQPLSYDIQKQEQEIEAAQWMPFEEYAAQPFVQKHDFLKIINETCKARMEGEYSGFCPKPTTSSFGESSCLYLNSSCIAPKRDSLDDHSN